MRSPVVAKRNTRVRSGSVVRAGQDPPRKTASPAISAAPAAIDFVHR